MTNFQCDHNIYSYLKEKIFTDWDEVRREIERETDRMAGSNKVLVVNITHSSIIK